MTIDGKTSDELIPESAKEYVDFRNAQGLPSVEGLYPADVAFYVSELRKIADGLESGQTIITSLLAHACIRETINEVAKEAHYAFTGRKYLAFVYHESRIGPENCACPGRCPSGGL